MCKFICGVARCDRRVSVVCCVVLFPYLLPTNNTFVETYALRPCYSCSIHTRTTTYQQSIAHEYNCQMSGKAAEPQKSTMDVESGREGISHWKMILDQGVVTNEIVNWEYEGSGTEEDPYAVEWLPNDPRNPMTFAKTKKWIMAIAVANSVLVVSFCSSAFSGGIQQIMIEFSVSQEVVTLGVSLFVLGFALGPLLWAPFSEMYGRQIVFAGTYLCFMAFNAAVAGGQNIWSVLILRFFAAAFGSSPLTNAGGVIADLFNANERGLAMSIFSAAPFMGPVLGPIIGGFLGMTEGWRWVNGLMAIWSGVLLVVTACIVPETYPPVLLRRRAEKLSKLTGKVYRSRTDIDQGKISLREAFSTGLKRPWILLFCEPIVLLLSLYHAIIYGILYMLFGAFPIVYRQGRGWNEGISGLPFVAVAIGVLLAITYVILVDNKQYMKKVNASGKGYTTPEARLPMCLVGGIALPIGLFCKFCPDGQHQKHSLTSVQGSPGPIRQISHGLPAFAPRFPSVSAWFSSSCPS